MTTPRDYQDPILNSVHESGRRNGHKGHRGHGWMMIACCIPMLTIAIALVATGVVGPSFLIVAVMCTLMMAMMMRGMSGMGGGPKA